MRFFILIYVIFLGFAVADDKKLSNDIFQVAQVINQELVKTKQDSNETSRLIALLKLEIQNLKFDLENLRWNIKQCESEKLEYKNSRYKTQSNSYYGCNQRNGVDYPSNTFMMQNENYVLQHENRRLRNENHMLQNVRSKENPYLKKN